MSKLASSLISPVRIAALQFDPDSVLSAVARALRRLPQGLGNDQERAWVEAIERRRSSLEQSTEVVEVPDFGAGAPGDSKTQAEMASGPVATEVVGAACKQYSKEPIWARLLFNMIRELKPKTCIELGSCMGVSAAYQAAALELNGTGFLYSLEGSPAFARLAGQTLETLGLAGRATIAIGPFAQTLPRVLATAPPVDYCFIDGHHDEFATYAYYEQVLKRLSPRAILVFDDIRWSPGMTAAWQKISRHSGISVAIDVGKVGICIVGPGRKRDLSLRIE